MDEKEQNVKHALSVALLGVTNVGKSTLFNRLACKDKSLVSALSGTTRDVQKGEITFARLAQRKSRLPTESVTNALRLYDLPGLDDNCVLFETKSQKPAPYVSAVLSKANLWIWVIDGTRPLNGYEHDLLKHLRRTKKTVWIVVNKCDGGARKTGADIPNEIGFRTFFHISALHGDGIDTLLNSLEAYASSIMKPVCKNSPNGAGAEALYKDSIIPNPLHIAFVGRVNVGKSTLMNNFLGYERMRSGPEEHLTRDAIKEALVIEGHPCLLWDTAGLAPKRKGRHQRGGYKTSLHDDVLKISETETLRAIQFAHVVVHVVEAPQYKSGKLFERADLIVAERIIKEGRAFVLAINKWDCVEQPKVLESVLKSEIAHTFFGLQGMQYVTLSAVSSKGVARLKKTILKAAELWCTELPTAPLNTLLQTLQQKKAPPIINGVRPKLKYITQVKTRPPTFYISGNGLSQLPQSYESYLLRGIRSHFNLNGTPLRLRLRTSYNPYKK